MLDFSYLTRQICFTFIAIHSVGKFSYQSKVAKTNPHCLAFDIFQRIFRHHYLLWKFHNIVKQIRDGKTHKVLSDFFVQLFRCDVS